MLIRANPKLHNMCWGVFTQSSSLLRAVLLIFVSIFLLSVVILGNGGPGSTRVGRRFQVPSILPGLGGFTAFLKTGDASWSEVCEAKGILQDDDEDPFVEPDQLINTDDDNYIHLGIKLTNLAKNDGNAYKLRLNFRKLIDSIFLDSIDRPIHFIFMTDKESVPKIREMMWEELPPFPLENWVDGDLVPRFTAEFVDMQKILDKVEPWSQTMQKFFNNPKSGYLMNYEDSKTGEKHSIYITTNDKYNSTMYYLAPFYHRIFTGLKRLATVDVDIVFNIDVNDFWKIFGYFDKKQLIGVGNDLAPHYHQMLTGFREKHPDTPFGEPGPFQGFNVGVLLLRLDRMRTDKVYNYHLTDKGVAKLAVKYGLTGTNLGEQDWMTLAGYENPELFLLLNCMFNRQLGRDYEKGPWLTIFPLFHDCPGEAKEEPYIVHGNSDSNI